MQFINKSLQIADPQAFGSRGKALLASKTKLKDIGFLEKDIIHYTLFIRLRRYVVASY